MGRWTDAHTYSVLKKMPDYEDDVNLGFKPLLRHMQDVMRTKGLEPEYEPTTGGQKEVEKDILLLGFVGVDSRLNSDCSGAVTDYLRVFLYEHGYAASFADTWELVDEVATEFPGLMLKQGEIRTGGPVHQPGLDYKMMKVSFAAAHPKAEELIAESAKALHALAAELHVESAEERAGDAQVSNPQVQPAKKKKRGKK